MLNFTGHAESEGDKYVSFYKYEPCIAAKGILRQQNKLLKLNKNNNDFLYNYY